jgi:hypothetical protein
MVVRGQLGDRHRRGQPRASHAAQRPLSSAQHRHGHPHRGRLLRVRLAGYRPAHPPPRQRRPGPWKTQPSRSRAARLAGGLGPWPPAQVPAAEAPGPSGAGPAHDARRRRPGAAADRQLNPRLGGGAWSSPRLPSSPSQSRYLLVPSLVEVLFLREVTMSSSQAGGIEGHQWSLHHTFGTRLPCRIVCECGWTSTAGQRTAVLLQLKGHLEDSLHSGARLLPAHDQPSAEIPNTPSS